MHAFCYSTVYTVYSHAVYLGLNVTRVGRRVVIAGSGMLSLKTIRCNIGLGCMQAQHLRGNWKKTYNLHCVLWKFQNWFIK